MKGLVLDDAPGLMVAGFFEIGSVVLPIPGGMLLNAAIMKGWQLKQKGGKIVGFMNNGKQVTNREVSDLARDLRFRNAADGSDLNRCLTRNPTTPPRTQISPNQPELPRKPRPNPKRTAKCNDQLAQDTETCSNTYSDPRDRAACYERAMMRYARCLAGEEVRPVLIPVRR